MGLQQKKRAERVQSVSGERRMNEEPELVRGYRVAKSPEAEAFLSTLK